MNDKTFVDTNVWIYLTAEQTSPKKAIANALLDKYPFTSPQVIFECVNVCRKKLKWEDAAAIDFVQRLLNVCPVATEGAVVVHLALELSRKYGFQPFDAKIVAIALEAGCNILYSEDMQYGLVVNDTLTIVNPFI